MTTEHAHPHLQEAIDQIIDILEGPAVPQPFGQPATRNDGLVDAVASVKDTQLVQGKDITEIKERLGNGGIKLKLPVGAWVAIAVAIIAGMAQVIASWIR